VSGTALAAGFSEDLSVFKKSVANAKTAHIDFAVLHQNLWVNSEVKW
jgi:hypothetical protein